MDNERRCRRQAAFHPSQLVVTGGQAQPNFRWPRRRRTEDRNSGLNCSGRVSNDCCTFSIAYDVDGFLALLRNVTTDCLGTPLVMGHRDGQVFG